MRATKLVCASVWSEKEMLQEKAHGVETAIFEIQKDQRRMIEVYKLLTNKYDDNTVHLDINLDTRTRGHTKKLVVRRCRYDVRKYSFCIRITNVWNSLPDEIISVSSVNTFKNRLDKLWAEQEVFFTIIKLT